MEKIVKAHYYVYVIRCKTGLYYVGMTNRLLMRWYEHTVGYGAYLTSRYGVWHFVFALKCTHKGEAMAMEEFLIEEVANGWVPEQEPCSFIEPRELVKILVHPQLSPKSIREYLIRENKWSWKEFYRLLHRKKS